MIEGLSTCVDRDSEIVEQLQAAHQASGLMLMLAGGALDLDRDPLRLVTRVLRLAAVGAACVEGAMADPDQPIGPAVGRIDPALRSGL